MGAYIPAGIAEDGASPQHLGEFEIPANGCLKVPPESIRNSSPGFNGHPVHQVYGQIGGPDLQIINIISSGSSIHNDNGEVCEGNDNEDDCKPVVGQSRASAWRIRILKEVHLREGVAVLGCKWPRTRVNVVSSRVSYIIRII